MKVLVQWTLANPTDWTELDVRPQGSGSRRWRDLPKKPVPGGGDAIDNQPGWVFDLNVQGVHFGGYDNYAVEPVAVDGEEGVRVTVWQDDPEDWPSGTRYASVWTFLDPAPDPRFNGAMNTRQSRVVYAESGLRDGVRPFGEFVPPASTVTKHGIWLSDGHARSHRDERGLHGWKEWIR